MKVCAIFVAMLILNEKEIHGDEYFFSQMTSNPVSTYAWDIRDLVSNEIQWKNTTIDLSKREAAIRHLSAIMSYALSDAPHLDKKVRLKVDDASLREFVTELSKASGGRIKIEIEGGLAVQVDVEAKNVSGIELLFLVLSSAGMVCDYDGGELIAKPFRELGKD